MVHGPAIDSPVANRAISDNAGYLGVHFCSVREDYLKPKVGPAVITNSRAWLDFDFSGGCGSDFHDLSIDNIAKFVLGDIVVEHESKKFF